jgi:predicted nucleotidyltransferase
VTALKATGIIVEYNPFHNGHKFHASQARKTTNADIVIAVMSGNFLQRGEPAFVDKWSRTKMALQNGVDLVYELPYAFATAHAPVFAQGAIQILDAARCQSFCFGSEDGNIEPFNNSLDLLINAKFEYEQTVKESVQEGMSYPKALNSAYQQAIQSSASNMSFADLTKPNNILGFHYLQAAGNIQSSMKAETISRIVADYHDDAVEGNSIASATGIRKSFFESNSLDAVQGFYPTETYDALREWQRERQSFGNWDTFYPFLRFTILREGPERLSRIADVTEGIENLFYRAAESSGTFEEFMNKVKSKRYTWTRIQRMLTHIFTGFTYDIRRQIEAPSYLRLLGMTQAGRLYLNENKKDLKLPLVSKVAAYSDPSMKMDVHATDMYALGIAQGTGQTLIGADYKHAPIFIRD